MSTCTENFKKKLYLNKDMLGYHQTMDRVPHAEVAMRRIPHTKYVGCKHA
jgi:hypothetical protein